MNIVIYERYNSSPSGIRHLLIKYDCVLSIRIQIFFLIIG